MSDIDKERTTWRKSSRSNGQQECVEVAAAGKGRVAVRDSKNPSGPMLLLTSADFAAIRRGIIADKHHGA
ncbi:DUF397 domain-containing protein [Actinomadura formosensis]|uniref:DUF397 domain-containing protein n=1 Tax=Actinomadura formosensis TaxID=60706 RepID=UPI000A051EC2|nr:DUF397 domain-containing protein [Actinomadura formosensis]